MRNVLLGFVSCLLTLVAHVPCSAQDASAPSTVQGFTEPYYDVHLGLPDAGRIASIKVYEGQSVSEGDVLLHLDKELQELEVVQSRLKLNSDTELKYAQKRASLLKRQYESAKSLFNDGAASRDDYETKQLEHAKAAAEAARLEMEKKLEKIELDLAREKLQRRILSAPFSGVVASIMKDPGESVQAQDLLVRLVDASRGRFVGSGEEAVGKQFSTGDTVCLNFVDSGLEMVPAKITFLSPTIDTASGFMEIKAEFDNSAAMARLGGAAELLSMQGGGCVRK